MAANELSIEKIVLILVSHIRLVTGLFVGAVFIAGVITYVTPKTYTASATINFTFQSNPVDNRGLTELAEKSYVQTQMDIMTSQRVAQKVEDGLTDYEKQRIISALDARFSVLDQIESAIRSPISAIFSSKPKKKEFAPDGGENSPSEKLSVDSPYGWLAEAMSWYLTVEPMPNSRIVLVSYTSTDPEVSAFLSNRFAEAYIETNIEMLTDPARKSKAWFDEQLKSLRTRLEEAQSKLTAYQQQEGVVSSDERLDTETSRLQELSNQLVAAQQATRNAVTERQKLQEVLASGASLMTFDPVFSNPAVQKSRAEIRDLEARFVENSASLGANHPRMVKLKSELAAARQHMQVEVKTITDGIKNGAELLSERERDLEKALEAQKQLVLNMKNEHDRIAVLQREVESAQATYNAALNQLNTTSMQSVVDQTNVSIVDRATVPSTHSSPRASTNLALGALAGLLLGVGLAVVMEMFTRRVYSREDLSAELGVPILAHLKKA